MGYLLMYKKSNLCYQVSADGLFKDCSLVLCCYGSLFGLFYIMLDVQAQL